MGTEPHNVIERILQKACQSMGGALRLLVDTDRYLNNKETGYNGGEVNDIFKRISATKKDVGQVQQAMPQEKVETVTRMDFAPEQGYDLAQGLPSPMDAELGMTLEGEPDQNLARNTGTTMVNQATPKTTQEKTTTGFGDMSAN